MGPTNVIAFPGRRRDPAPIRSDSVRYGPEWRMRVAGYALMWASAFANLYMYSEIVGYALRHAA